jgi:hypothetical protein
LKPLRAPRREDQKSVVIDANLLQRVEDLTDVIIAFHDENGLRKETPTIAEFFKKNGYETYFSGKWHLGDKPKPRQIRCRLWIPSTRHGLVLAAANASRGFYLTNQAGGLGPSVFTFGTPRRGDLS